MDVAVVGSINVDLVAAVASLPAPGETVLGRRIERHGGGKGANAAVAAARLGARVALIGGSAPTTWAPGAGRAARRGDRRLRRRRARGEATGMALIVVDERGENQIAVGGRERA